MNVPGRCIVYVRVSSKEQLEGHSLDAQREQCVRFAQARSWQVVEVFEGEGESAKSDKRKGFQKAIAALRAGRGDILVTHRVDRFARNLTDALAYWNELKTLGVSYCSVTEQFDFTTPHGWLMMVMLAALAELFLKNLSQETAKGKRQRAVKGLWNGDLAFGYRRAEGGPEAEPDPDTAPGVRLAFQEFAKGAHNDLGIAHLLNEAGYRTRGKRGSIPFSKDTVRAMLTNRFYLGEVAYKGDVFPGRHPPLVDEALWERCQAVRRRRQLAPRQGKRGSRVYPLAGLAHCAGCRRPLRGQHLHGRRYYRDPDRDYDGSCAHPRAIRAEDLEAEVARALMAVSLPAAGTGKLVARAGAGRDAKAVERRKARAEEKIRRANELYLDGLIDRPALDRAVLEARAELDALRPVQPFNRARAERLLADLPQMWELANAGERKRLLQAMLERVYVRGTQVVAVQPTDDLYPLLRCLWRTRRGFGEHLPKSGPRAPDRNHTQTAACFQIVRPCSNDARILGVNIDPLPGFVICRRHGWDCLAGGSRSASGGLRDAGWPRHPLPCPRPRWGFLDSLCRPKSAAPRPGSVRERRGKPPTKVVIGVAYLNPKDKPNDHIGRQVSLNNALTKFGMSREASLQLLTQLNEQFSHRSRSTTC